MEYVIKELLHPEEDDEANFIYSELDSQRRETRRVEFYPSGMCFAYGGDMGQDEVLGSSAACLASILAEIILPMA